MKVFRIYTKSHFYAYSGRTEKEAVDTFIEDQGDQQILEIEEIPEYDWDKKDIQIYEDNNIDTEPYFVSIREEITDTPGMIFTNDLSFL